MARDNNYEAYTSDYFAQYDSTISNGEARIPICFCIDTSSSMGFILNRREDFTVTSDSYMTDGHSVRSVQLKPGVKEITPMTRLIGVMLDMLHRMQRNSIIRDSAVVSIITFDRYADCVKEFSQVQNIYDREIENLKPKGEETNTSRGINMALERLDRFRESNARAGNESYKPVFILMSDGSPTDGRESKISGQKLRDRSEAGKMNVIPIAIGASDSSEVFLRGLSKDSRVYRMQSEAEFDEVFKIITSRIVRTARVISVDEDVAAAAGRDSKEILPEPNLTMEDTSSTQYGDFSSLEDLEDFMRQFAMN